MLALRHDWTDASGFSWTDACDANGLLREALEPHSGLQFSGHADAADEWAVRTIECAGASHVVLTSVRLADPLPDGRPMRSTRHLVLDAPPGGTLPGALLHEDLRRPIGPGGDLGDDTTSSFTRSSTQVPWSACGGDWTDAISTRIRQGEPVRVIFPATCSALEWWRAVEQAAGECAWHRTVLLERMPDTDSADVVLAVEGTACATAMRDSGRQILDLARAPHAPDAATTTDDPDTSTPTPIPAAPPDVALAPGGPPVGLVALTLLAAALVIGAIVVIIMALQSGTTA